MHTKVLSKNKTLTSLNFQSKQILTSDYKEVSALVSNFSLVSILHCYSQFDQETCFYSLTVQGGTATHFMVLFDDKTLTSVQIETPSPRFIAK